MSKYEIKESIDNYIYKTFNLWSGFRFNFSNDKKLSSENINFKNIHRDERCYIVGTGPSLKNVDLKFLDDEIVFGVNYLYKSKKAKCLKPKYYFLYDENFYKNNVEDTMEALSFYKDSIFFVRTNAHKDFKKKGIKDTKIYYQPCNFFQYNDFISIDMVRGMTAPYNVVLGCIQTAMYMGFKYIYLLGSDYNSFASLKVEHEYDDVNTLVKRHMTLGYEMKFYTMCTYHHYALEKYAKKNQIHIYNITDKSLLDAYERIDCSEHIKSILKKKKD